MEASHTFGPFLRFLSGFKALFTKRGPTRLRQDTRTVVDAPVSLPARQVVREAALQRPAPVMQAPDAPASGLAPAAMAPVATAPVAAPVAPGPAKPMRTLEEVRADLARLRAKSRERQAAQVSARPDASFAPTDFMDLRAPRAQGPAETRDDEDPEQGFAATAFLDFSTLVTRGKA